MAALGYAERERIRQEQGEGSLSYLLKGATTDGCCRMVSLTSKHGHTYWVYNVVIYSIFSTACGVFFLSFYYIPGLCL